MTEKHFERILIIDDDNEYCEILENTLMIENFRVESVYTGEDGLRRISERAYDVVILDLTLPDISGMQVLKRIKEIKADTQVIIVTAVDTVGSAVESLKAGAFDFITKPIMLDDVVVSIKKALRHQKKMVASQQSGAHYKELIGDSQAMSEVKGIIAKVAPTDSTVLITGESGTGKELIAHSIYENSVRKDKPFVKISCAALPDTLLESELFGYMKGAFTGATSTKKGLFEVAHGGTLFLDEVSEVSLNIQAKLLRALQEKEIKPLGSTQDIPVDVRFIAATNKDLKEEIAKGNFREDLFYRLNVINIQTVPLRERKEDIPLFADYFIAKYTPKKSTSHKKMSSEVLQCFSAYRWPGNIRELENVIERAIILGSSEVITLADIPERIRSIEPLVSSIGGAVSYRDTIPGLDAAVEALERDLITAALHKSNGVVSTAAKILQVKRTTLIAKMKKLQIK